MLNFIYIILTIILSPSGISLGGDRAVIEVSIDWLIDLLIDWLTEHNILNLH